MYQIYEPSAGGILCDENKSVCLNSKFAVWNHRFVFSNFTVLVGYLFFKTVDLLAKKNKFAPNLEQIRKTNRLFQKTNRFQQIGDFEKQIGDMNKNKSVISDCTNILKRPICFSICYSQNKFVFIKNKFVFLI